MSKSSIRLGARLLGAAIACGLAAPAFAAPEPDATDRFIVRFKPGTAEHNDVKARQRVLDAVGDYQGLSLGQVRHLAVGAELVRTDRKLDAAAARAFMQRLARDPRVEYVEPERRYRRAFTPNDQHYGIQWHYSEAIAGIGAPAAWDVATGAGTVVAVLDTGIVDHVDLGANIVGGYDFITSLATAGDGNGRDSDPHDPGDFVAEGECGVGEPAEDSSWHGTHVAGTVAALTNNSIGVAGVAFNAKVVPVRVLGRCGGSNVDIAEAIMWAAGGSVTGVPANPNPAEVINLSLGGFGACDNTTQAAINFAVSNGTTVVVAAGNDNLDATLFSPASCANVVTVGAVGRTGARAGYSNYGPKVDLAAPGGADGNGIASTIDTGESVPAGAGYAYYQGTSMAAPHVAGVVALMQSQQANSPALVETILKASARTFPVPCDLGCGAGLLTAPVALSATTQPFLYVSDPAAAIEGDSGTRTITFTVSLSQTVANPVTFDIATAGGTATSGVDFVAKTATGQSIAAGQLSKTFVVTVNGDTAVEPRENFFVNVTNIAGIAALDVQAFGQIADDDFPPLANGVPLTGLSATEGTQTLYRMDVPSGATNLQFNTTGGTAGQDVDLLVRRGEPPTLDEAECVSESTSSTENCTFASPAAGTWYVMLYAFTDYSGVTLTGSYSGGTAPAPTLSLSNATVTEGNSGTKLMTFTAALSSAASSTVTFNATTNDGNAVGGQDFVSQVMAGQSIPAGQVAKTFSVTINGDTVVEPDETFTVTLSNAVGATITDGTGLGTITNDDGPLPSLSIGNAQISEGNSGTKGLRFTVTLSQAASGPVSYSIATANHGSAVAGSDYAARSAGSQVIPAGTLSKIFDVVINGDTAVEAHETFSVNLSGVTGASVSDGQGQGTILNDDGPTPVLTIADASITEGNSGTKGLRFTMTLSQASSSAVSFTAATANGTAVAGTDYTSRAAGLTIPAGTTSKIFDVVLNGDTAVEGNETFFVNLTNVNGASLGDGQAVGTILNDDGGPTISIGDVSITEGNSGVKGLRFTATLSQVATAPVTYTIGTANGTAVAGIDYVARSAGGQVIPAGMQSKIFDVVLNGDTTTEANETFFVNLSGVTGATIADGQAVGTILNDDGGAVPSISVADVSITEGNSGIKGLRFTVTLSQASTSPVTYTIGTANGTALAGSDYTARTVGGQVIPAGTLTKIFDVVLNGDTAVEANETFVVNLSGVSGANVGDGQAVGTILNDDVPSVSIGNASITEGNSGIKGLRFTVTLSQASTGPVTYAIGTADGTALAGSDYAARAAGGQVIPAGTTSKIFDVVLNGDTSVEANETFAVNLGSVTGATVADGQATGTILNDDVPSLSIDNVAVSEGAGTATFTATLSQAATTAVTFRYTTIDGTAQGGPDFGSQVMVGKTIPAGQLSTTFAIAITNDAASEATESFGVNLSDVVGATVADGAGTATISDDD